MRFALVTWLTNILKGIDMRLENVSLGTRFAQQFVFQPLRIFAVSAVFFVQATSSRYQESLLHRITFGRLWPTFRRLLLLLWMLVIDIFQIDVKKILLVESYKFFHFIALNDYDFNGMPLNYFFSFLDSRFAGASSFVWTTTEWFNGIVTTSIFLTSFLMSLELWTCLTFSSMEEVFLYLLKKHVGILWLSSCELCFGFCFLKRLYSCIFVKI